MAKKWIQKVNFKKGALSRQLGIPEKDNIPKTLLNKIVNADKGERFKNPTKSGKRYITATTLLKRRANASRTLKSFKK